jgi:hypothetical protein
MSLCLRQGKSNGFCGHGGHIIFQAGGFVSLFLFLALGGAAEKTMEAGLSNKMGTYFFIQNYAAARRNNLTQQSASV